MEKLGIFFPVFHSVDGLEVEFLWNRVRLFDPIVVQGYFDLLLEDGPIAKVEDCRTRPKSKWRPLPMDTLVLQNPYNLEIRNISQTFF